MSTKKATKVRNIPLPLDVDAALVKAAKDEGRSTRAHIAHLLAVCVGLACLALACSGAPTSPVEGSGDHSTPTDAGPDACPAVGEPIEKQCATVMNAGFFCVNPCTDAGTSCCYESVCGRAECAKP